MTDSRACLTTPASGCSVKLSALRGGCLAAAALVISLSISVPAGAQESGLTFLQIGVDGRSEGMGDAQVASASGAFATYWNPAGLAVGSTNAIGLSHHIWIGDVRTYALAGSFRLGARSAAGLFVTSSSSGDLELRDAPGPPQGTFDAQFLAAGISYGRTVGPLRAGMTLKYLSEEIFSERAGGYGFDFGVQADLVGEAVSLGATLRNVGRMSDLNAVATELPRALRAGVEFRPFRVLTVDDESLLDVVAAVDVSYLIPDERTQYHFGLEAEILGVLDVRGGAISNDTVRQFSGGVGFQYGAFVFDYALVTFESGFGGPGHILTVGYAW